MKGRHHPTAWPCTASMLVRRAGLPWTTHSIHGIVRPWLQKVDCPRSTRWPHYYLVSEELAKRFAAEHGLTLGPDPAGGRPGKPAASPGYPV